MTSACASLAGSPDCWPFWASYHCPAGGVALGVVRDGRLGVGRRLLREELGAEEPGVDDGGVDAERRDLGLQRLHPPLQAELGGAVGGIELKAR